MKIRMTQHLSGPTVTYATGDEYDLPQDEAVRLLSAGFAVPVAEPVVERAVATTKAVEKRGKRDGVVSSNGNDASDE